MLLEKYLKIGISTIVMVMMVTLTWSVLNDKKLRDKMHANSLIQEQVKTIADKTVKVGKGIFTSSEEAEANIVKEKVIKRPTVDIVKTKIKKTLPKATKKALKSKEKLVPAKKKLGMIWIVTPAVKVAGLEKNNKIKVVTNG